MDYELYHHGILGQKWGVRRFQNPDGSLTPEGKKRYGVDELSYVKKSQNVKKEPDRYNNKSKKSARKEARKNELLDAKDRRLLSNDELTARIKRIQMEKQYKDLVDQEVAPGKAYIKSVLKASGTKVLMNVTTGGIEYLIGAAFNKKDFNWGDLGKSMATGSSKLSSVKDEEDKDEKGSTKKGNTKSK